MFEDCKWYVVHTYSGYENKVANDIMQVAENRGMRDQILEVCVPTETVKEIRTVKKRKGKSKKQPEDDFDTVSEFYDEENNPDVETVEKEVERKLFPGYVLVKLAIAYDEKAQETKMTDEVWYIIRNTRGVTGFVGPEGKPVPLTEKEVLQLGVEKHTVSVGYEVGDLVTIIGGSFDGFSGTVEDIDLEKDTVRVIISILGRDAPIELGLDQVELAVN